MNYMKKWKLFSIIAVTLVGLGINLVAEATLMKGVYDSHIALWFWTGLFGIIAINAGLSFMGEAVKSRIYAELKQKEDSNGRMV